MARINKLKTVPVKFLNWLNKEYKNSSEYTFKWFYWYRSNTGIKIYGCNVFKGDELWSNPQIAENNL